MTRLVSTLLFSSRLDFHPHRLSPRHMALSSSLLFSSLFSLFVRVYVNFYYVPFASPCASASACVSTRLDSRSKRLLSFSHAFTTCFMAGSGGGGRRDAARHCRPVPSRFVSSPLLPFRLVSSDSDSSRRLQWPLLSSPLLSTPLHRPISLALHSALALLVPFRATSTWTLLLQYVYST